MWNISWVLLRDLDRKIEDAPRRCEIANDLKVNRVRVCQELLVDRSDDDERPERPSTSTEDPHVDKINTLVRANRRLTIRELTEECGISVGSCYEILTAKLKMFCATPDERRQKRQLRLCLSGTA